MKLLCLGDVAISDSDISRLVLLPPNGMIPNDEVKILLNWELPIGTVVNPTPRVRGSRLLANPNSIDVFEKWVPGYATLATNHILDADIEGLINTKLSLNKLGISTVGAGTTKREIQEPVIWESSQGSLGIINWVFSDTHPDWMAIPGPNCWPGVEEAEKVIKTLKKQVDWLMVVVHWSDEHFPYPLVEDRQIARRIAESGADIIIGHHPHVVRGMELMGSCPVFYSLGNYYFPFGSAFKSRWIVRQAPRHREALGVMISFERGEGLTYQTFSYWMKRNGIIQDPLHRALRRMRLVSRPLQRSSDSDYADWYTSKRSHFDRWGSYLYFGVWKLTPDKIKKKLLGFIR